MTETAIIQGCVKGDRRAQEALFRLYSGRLMTLCRRYARNPMEAEDMLQEGFIRVFRYIGQYKGAGSFEGWLKRVIINTALRYLKKHNSIEWEKPASEYPNLDPGMVPDIIDKMQIEELIKEIERLPVGYRIVFNMSVFDGFSHKEIASQLGIEESSSRSQLYHARQWLIRRLQKQEIKVS